MCLTENFILLFKLIPIRHIGMNSIKFMTFTVFGLNSDFCIRWTASMPISVINKTASIIKQNSFHDVSMFLVSSSDNATLCGLTSILDGGTGHEIIFFIIILYNDQQIHKIISQIITLLHVSTMSCHPQTACNQCLAKLHQYFKNSCW